MKRWVCSVIQTNSCWQNVFAVLVMAFAAIAAGSVVLMLLKLTGLLSADVAAWVQAIGSIAAILGAYGIAAQQRRHDNEAREVAERQDQLNRLNLAVALAVHSARAVRDSHKQMREHVGGDGFLPDYFVHESIIELTNRFVPNRCPPEVAVQMIALERHVIAAMRDLKRVSGWGFIKEEDIQRAMNRGIAAKQIMLGIAAVRNEARELVEKTARHR